MGSALSIFQSTKECNITSICGLPAKGLAAGAAGAGKGTFWAFFITAISTIILAFFAIGFQWAASQPAESYNTSKEARRELKRQHIKDKRVIEHVILSFSDQQLVTGLAMAVTTRYFTDCNLPVSAYHYDIVCYLLLCSVVTHLCTIVAVNHYFYFWTGSARASFSRFVFLAIRCIGMAVTIILTGLILFNRNQSTFPVKPPSSPAADPAKLLLRPAACFFTGAESITAVVKDIPEALSNWNIKNWDHGLIQFAIFILAVAIAIPVAILHSLERGFCSRDAPVTFFSILRITVVACGLTVVVWNLWLAYTLRDFMHSSGWLKDVAAMEQSWTFGQLLSILILVFAPFTAFNAAADKYDRRHHLDSQVSMSQSYEASKYATRFVNNGD